MPPVNVRLENEREAGRKTDPVAPLPSSQPDRMTQNVIGLPPPRAGVYNARVMAKRAGKIHVGREESISR